MPSRYQDPDDLNCIPAVFKTFSPGGAVEQTFWVRHPWAISTKKLGELVITETLAGDVLLKIVMEPQ